MEIYKIIADRKPKECLLCPIRNTVEGQCGKRKFEKLTGGWETEYLAPDDRCKFEIFEGRFIKAVKNET